MQSNLYTFSSNVDLLECECYLEIIILTWLIMPCIRFEKMFFEIYVSSY